VVQLVQPLTDNPKVKGSNPAAVDKCLFFATDPTVANSGRRREGEVLQEGCQVSGASAVAVPAGLKFRLRHRNHRRDDREVHRGRDEEAGAAGQGRRAILSGRIQGELLTRINNFIKESLLSVH